MRPADKAVQILAVDDDEGILILIAETLRAEGFTVATAPSGAAALRWLEGHRPDLMLLDLKMKEVGGNALLERLRERAAPVPFVVITGQGDAKATAAVMKQGALDYVMKDMGLLDLLPGVVRQALATIEKEKVLAAAQLEQRRLEAEILHTTEREQRRIGEDLHDGLGQQLTAIELLCAGLQEEASAVHPGLATRLSQMSKLLREAVGQTRMLARGLVPVSDDPDALRTGLMELIERTNAVGRIKCRLECAGPILIADRAVAGHLYRIGQEAINNALKHAHARSVVVRLGRRGAALQLQISDDGRGLPKTKWRGMGLGVMDHRARMIGAKLAITSTRDQGVTVTCLLPWPK